MQVTITMFYYKFDQISLKLLSAVKTSWGNLQLAYDFHSFIMSLECDLYQRKRLLIVRQFKINPSSP